MTKKDDLIRVTEEPTIIQCDMNQQEKEYDQEQLLQCLQKINDLESEKKAVTAQFGARAKKLAEVLSDLQNGLMSGKKMRSVQCTLTLNYSTLTAELRVKEGGQLVQSRPMSLEERRMDPTPKLPGVEEESPEPAIGEGNCVIQEDTTPKEGEVYPEADPTEESDTGAESNGPTDDESSAASGMEEMGFEPVTEETEDLTTEEANKIADEKLGGALPPVPEEKPTAPADADNAQADADLNYWLGQPEGE